MPFWLKLLLQARFSWWKTGGGSTAAKTGWIQQQEPGNSSQSLMHHCDFTSKYISAAKNVTDYNGMIAKVISASTRHKS